MRSSCHWTGKFCPCTDKTKTKKNFASVKVKSLEYEKAGGRAGGSNLEKRGGIDGQRARTRVC